MVNIQFRAFRPIYSHYIYLIEFSVYRFENELVVAVGKGEPTAVRSEYGFK